MVDRGLEWEAIVAVGWRIAAGFTSGISVCLSIECELQHTCDHRSTATGFGHATPRDRDTWHVTRTVAIGVGLSGPRRASTSEHRIESKAQVAWHGSYGKCARGVRDCASYVARPSMKVIAAAATPAQ